jgi:pyruvate kinase
MMDVPGPKLRTGPLAPGPEVLKWRPHRDVYGRVTAPARLWLTPADAPCPPPGPADASLPVDRAWLSQLETGDTVAFKDARGARRLLHVVEAAGENRWAKCTQTAYVATGMVLRRVRASRSSRRRRPGSRTTLGQLPATSQSIMLHRGDTLILTDPAQPGGPALLDEQGQTLSPAHIGCTAPEVFRDLQPGQRLWLDDGKIGGIIRGVHAEHVEVEIAEVRAQGARLGADKGINLPESTLHIPSLTAQDITCLPFVAAHADMVGYSFVRSPADVAALQEELARVGGEQLAIVLKIETRAAVDALPALLLAAMRSPSCGVMIARGDLAVECGYERLAELQEEILCLAEAAHMPVIWATQVLETLAQHGVPSRAEISDAAMGERAECVMLNKGPYIVEAVRALDDILRRMQGHQDKRSARLRPLRLARNFWPAGTGRG